MQQLNKLPKVIKIKCKSKMDNKAKKKIISSSRKYNRGKEGNKRIKGKERERERRRRGRRRRWKIRRKR